MNGVVKKCPSPENKSSSKKGKAVLGNKVTLSDKPLEAVDNCLTDSAGELKVPRTLLGQSKYGLYSTKDQDTKR